MSNFRSRLFASAAVCGVIASTVAAPAFATAVGSAASLNRANAEATRVSPFASSRYLAGYRATDPKHVSEVIIKAVDVPNVSCSDPRFEGVALGGGSEPALGELEYFAGIHLICTSGQAQYLMEAIAGDSEQGTGIEPGDQAQIVITLQCDSYPTCDIFASATSLDTATEVSVETTIDVSTDSAVFGAFPLFGEGSEKPAPVPQFGEARIRGCLFDNHLLDRSAQRLTLVRHGAAKITASKIDVGSFKLKRTAG